jgi:L-arabinose isomerase
VDRESLEDFATIAGVELAWIDDTSNTVAFTRELQWNAAVYDTIGRR